MSRSFAIDTSSDLAFEVSTTLATCSVVGTPRALAVKLLLENQEYGQLLDLETNPLYYEEPSNFAEDYLVTEMLSKSANLPLGIDRQQVAKDSFYESEEQCRVTNDTFRGYAERLPPELYAVRQWVHRIVGDLTPDLLDDVVNHARFGAGATTGVKGQGSCLSDKYDEQMHVTQKLAPFARAVLGDKWMDYLLRGGRSLRIVEGSKFFTVPKNAKTDRGAATEATLNSRVQLGADRVLRKRLKRFGIDLSTQSVNQVLAELSYACGFATIDMSKASDLIAWWVVYSLFPQRWFELLDLARSERILIDGEWRELEKFSSMGNGFTFAVETVIFLAVCLACVPRGKHRLITVYGDDIIVPAEDATNVIGTLELLGFRVNTKKSFLAGSFFESCGTDWFKGQNVRPYYLRSATDPEMISGAPYTLQVANALRLWSRRTSYDGLCNSKWKPLWLAIRSRVPKAWRDCPIPDQLGDSGLIVSRGEALPGSVRRPFKKISVRVKPDKLRVRRVDSGEEGYMVKQIHSAIPTRRKGTYGVELMRLDILSRSGDHKDPDLETSRIWNVRNLHGVCATAFRQELRISANHARNELKSVPPMFDGHEPVRGYLGRESTKWVLVSHWDPSLAWSR